MFKINFEPLRPKKSVFGNNLLALKAKNQRLRPESRCLRHQISAYRAQRRRLRPKVGIRPAWARAPERGGAAKRMRQKFRPRASLWRITQGAKICIRSQEIRTPYRASNIGKRYRLSYSAAPSAVPISDRNRRGGVKWRVE